MNSVSSQKILKISFICSLESFIKRSVTTIPGEMVHICTGSALCSRLSDRVNWVIAALDPPYTLWLGEGNPFDPAPSILIRIPCCWDSMIGRIILQQYIVPRRLVLMICWMSCTSCCTKLSCLHTAALFIQISI